MNIQQLLKRWFPVFIIAVAIFYASSIPNLHLVNQSIFPAWFKQWVGQHTIKIGDTGFFSYSLSFDPDFILHKLGHVSVYGLLGLASFFATRSKKWALTFVLLYAISDEIHQYFTPGRSCRFWDIVLDFIAGWVAILPFGKRRRL